MQKYNPDSISALEDNLSIEQFKSLFPNCSNPLEWFEAMAIVFPKSSINTLKRQCAFIAQCGHESGGWRVFTENLNYSSSALNKVFPKYFIRVGRDANQYHRKPEMIANVVYANRMGNGNESSGDGWKYRGRGPIQLTGKNNYASFQKSSIFQKIFGATGIDVVRNPELVSDNREIAILSAIWFWESNSLNVQSDNYDIKLMTRKINGGYNGLEDRKHHYIEIAKMMLGTQRKGNNNHKVSVIQEIINTTSDGIFGSGTESSVKHYQRKYNLSADGIVGAKTVECLMKNHIQ